MKQCKVGKHLVPESEVKWFHIDFDEETKVHVLCCRECANKATAAVTVVLFPKSMPATVQQ